MKYTASSRIHSTGRFDNTGRLAVEHQFIAILERKTQSLFVAAEVLLSGIRLAPLRAPPEPFAYGNIFAENGSLLTTNRSVLGNTTLLTLASEGP
jgi:hypothetical protein